MIIIGSSCTGDDISSEDEVETNVHVDREYPKFPQGREGVKQQIAYYGKHWEFTNEDLKWVNPIKE